MENLEFMELEKENIEDLNEVVELINKAYRGKIQGNSWTGEAHLLSGIRINLEMLKEYLQEKNTITYIAKINNKVVGTIQTKLENEDIHIGLFAVSPNIQASGVGKQLLEFAENSSKKLWNKNSFIIEVISLRVELIEYYIRRGYKNTNTYMKFPKSQHWSQNIDEELKLLVLRKALCN